LEDFMRALAWHGKHDIRCDTVPDPEIQHPRDAIIKVTSCAICGSDLHIYDGMIPRMETGDALGHETMGEVVEVGTENKKLKASLFGAAGRSGNLPSAAPFFSGRPV
jgi:threonine dehydrogenase-like Zn-dependent dehydrogenase